LFLIADITFNDRPTTDSTVPLIRAMKSTSDKLYSPPIIDF